MRWGADRYGDEGRAASPRRWGLIHCFIHRDIISQRLRSKLNEVLSNNIMRYDQGNPILLDLMAVMWPQWFHWTESCKHSINLCFLLCFFNVAALNTKYRSSLPFTVFFLFNLFYRRFTMHLAEWWKIALKSRYDIDKSREICLKVFIMVKVNCVVYGKKNARTDEADNF